MCKYKVAAIGFNRRGEFLGIMTNRPRFNHEGGSEHAELRLLRHYGLRVRTIILIRTNASGTLKPIHPCKVCATVLQALGIRVRTI